MGPASSAVRAAPWVSYRRGIDLGSRPIESSLCADPVINPPQADASSTYYLHHTGSRPVPKLGPAGIDERTAPLEIRLRL